MDQARSFLVAVFVAKNAFQVLSSHDLGWQWMTDIQSWEVGKLERRQKGKCHQIIFRNPRGAGCGQHLSITFDFFPSCIIKINQALRLKQSPFVWSNPFLKQSLLFNSTCPHRLGKNGRLPSTSFYVVGGVPCGFRPLNILDSRNLLQSLWLTFGATTMKADTFVAQTNFEDPVLKFSEHKTSAVSHMRQTWETTGNENKQEIILQLHVSCIETLANGGTSFL